MTDPIPDGVADPAPRALAFVRAAASERAAEARRVFAGVRNEIPSLRAHLAAASVSLNFHPYRLDPQGRCVAEGLCEGGRYISQFVSGVSNGKLDAGAEGERSAWERHLFGGAYDHVAASLRPTYGALNLLGAINGAAPRFGCSHLRLRREVNARSTFCWGDSYLFPAWVADVETFEALLKPLSTHAANPGPAAELWRALKEPPLTAGFTRELDVYVEAQVHGPLDLRRDCLSIHLDENLRKSACADLMELAARRWGVPIAYFEGPRLKPSSLSAEFRGASTLAFVARLADEGGEAVHAGTLARAEERLTRAPGSYADFGEREDLLQLLKRAWHSVLAHGER